MVAVKSFLSKSRVTAWNLLYPNCNLAEGSAAGCWVHLQELPNPYSFDEALLLCQLEGDDWLAWIPDHGEAIINAKQFCQI